MASLDGVLTKQALSQNWAINVGSDQPVAIRIRNKAKKAVTSVTVTTATNIVLIDADGTTTSTFAADTTIGAVADTINRSTNWECLVLDSLRSDASASKLVDGVISASVVEGVTVYDALVDTSAMKALTVRACHNRVPSLERDVSDRRVRLHEINYLATLGSGGEANGFRVYHVKDSVETLVLPRTSVSAASTTVYLLNGVPVLDSEAGHDLVIRLIDSNALADNAANFLQVTFNKE